MVNSKKNSKRVLSGSKKTKVVKKSTVSKKSSVKKNQKKKLKKVEFDLTLPEPPKPPQKNYLSKTDIKKVKLDEQDFSFPVNFNTNVVSLLKSKKSISAKNNNLHLDYKKHLDNHMKFAKLEVGKIHPEIQKNPNMNAQQIIDSVRVIGPTFPEKHVKVDIGKIIRLNKPHEYKANLLKENFKENIKKHIESVEFNVEYNISENQPFFDELEELNKKIPDSEIPKPEDFFKMENKKNSKIMPNLLNKFSKIFPEKNISDNKNSINNSQKPKTKSALFGKFLNDDSSVIKDNSLDEISENNLDVVTAGDELETFVENENIKKEAYKLVIPANKIKQKIERRKSLEEHESDLVKRETELLKIKDHHEREKEDLEQEKINYNQEFLELQKTLDLQTKELEEKRINLVTKEENLNKKEDELKRKEVDVKRILEKETELNDLKITLDTKNSELKKKETSLDRKEKNVDEKIRKYELLKAENDRFKKIETLESQLSVKEARVVEKQGKLNEKETYLKSREDEIKIKEKSLQEKEKDLNSKLKNYRKDKTSQLEKKEKELKNLESEIEERKKQLDDYKNQLEESKDSIEKSAEKVEDDEFNLLITEEKIKQKYGEEDVPSSISFDDLEKVDEVLNLPELEQAQIYRLVSRCRELLRKRNYEDAKRVYNEIKDRYSKLEVEEDDKQIIYNTVRELYDDIRLAMIY